MFEKFTEEAIQVLKFARDEADRLRKSEIDAISSRSINATSILRGILDHDQEFAGIVLNEFDVKKETLISAIDAAPKEFAKKNPELLSELVPHYDIRHFRNYKKVLFALNYLNIFSHLRKEVDV